jgi:hypothetical protein
MNDLCMFCLNDCITYIKLEYCTCKTIAHEECFENYLELENKYIKCIICRKKYNINTSIDNFFNSIFSMLFIALQNSYFYIDNKFLFNFDIYLRLIFILIFHTLLLLISIFPYFFIIHTKYICNLIYKLKLFKICKKKIYKVYNL